MELFSNVTFMECAMALIAVGLIERGLLLLPESAVGPQGWLLRTGA